MSSRAAGSERRRRMLLAKTSLDGHWRGLVVVARALRDAGFEIVMLGQATSEHIAAAAVDEDVGLVGLNVGGRVEVVERVLEALWAQRPNVPVLAGGTIPPSAATRLEDRGVRVFPPGSSIDEIVAEARTIVDSTEPRGQDVRDSGAP